MAQVRAIEMKDGVLRLIDQRKLPGTLEMFECKNYRDVDFAIKDMVVRGAPAIGVSAGYGVYLAAEEFKDLSKDEFLKKLDDACTVLYNSRPTAVNLMWAIRRMRALIASFSCLLVMPSTLFPLTKSSRSSAGRANNAIA